MNRNEVNLVPLVDSMSAVNALKNKKVDYIVVATKNSIAGTVMETYNAIKDNYLHLVGTVVLPIHHCLFKKKGVANDKIDTIASHVQALSQTKNYRNKYFPNCQEREMSDTAISAKYLSEGLLGDNCAVICRDNAGLMYDLELIQMNIEDCENNRTEFRIFKLPEENYSNKNKPSLLERIRYLLVVDKKVNILVQILIIIINALAIFAAQYLNALWISIASAAGVDGATIILLLASNSLKRKERHYTLVGYWKYYSLSENFTDENPQNFTTPRIVKIEEIDGDLKISGVICDNENVPFFESTKVLVTSVEKQENHLVYWYHTPHCGGKRVQLSGIVDLSWDCKYPAALVYKMEGHYNGLSDKGHVTFLRISQLEYEAHMNSEFI